MSEIEQSCCPGGCKPSWCVPSALLMGFLTAAVAAANDMPRYFSIKMNDNLIGYAVIERELVEQIGQKLLRLRSVTSLKVAMLGKPRNTLLDSETLIEPESGNLISYRMTDTTNEIVQHVEAELRGDLVRCWSYREGDQRGKPLGIELPEGAVILGSNNFGHWQWLLKAAADRAEDGVAKLPVFLPEARKVDELELVRGELQEVALPSGMRSCVSWHLEEANLTALADPQTNELVRLELPGQQTTIELASVNVVKLADKSRAEEVLTRHFAQSDVVFDDFLSIRAIKADIDVKVIGTGVANDATVLTTAMQQFEGTKDTDHVLGTVTIASVPFDAKRSPIFPTESPEPDLAKWLEPTPYIESDHPSIVTKAAELTQDAKTRWDAVQMIGKWVYEEIAYTIADTPSARLALEKKKGDCGPHATLMVALLRAQGIPARLVGGLVYTPTFGGSFGQHAWVEIHMGEAGWLAVDPTTGEFQQLSATHIKLFEGLGGVLPASIKVISFEPPNRETSPAMATEAKPLPWQLGKQYTFRYKQGDDELGQETITIAKINREGEEAYELKSETSLTLGPHTALRSDTTLVTALNALPISFERDLAAGDQQVKIHCDFQEGAVAEEITGTTNLSREMKLPDKAYCFDNNFMGCFLLICSQLTLEPGKPLTIQTFHPSTLQIIPLTFEPKAVAPITIEDKEVECFETEVQPIKNTFWISRDGRFVRIKQGDLVIEVTEID